MTPAPRPPRRVILLGATGTIGRATAAELLRRGHAVICPVRPLAGAGLPAGVILRRGAGDDIGSVLRAGFADGDRPEVLVSCLASRTGAPAEAWAIDHHAHVQALRAALEAGVGQVVLLSAICVQHPRLAFQHAKLAFEAELAASGVDHVIVRPTAYFKSLSGQIARVRAGKPFLVFGDGRLTACKPISDADLAAYLADCIDAPDRRNRILPIGGPGPAITPRDQGEALFRLLGRAPRFRQVPPGLLRTIAAGLDLGGMVAAGLRDKAELARIGHYYATESMLVRDPATGRYEADATPETGQDRLFDHYARVIRGDEVVERGAHSVF